MNHTLSYKTKQFFFVLIKLGIVAGAFYFIYKKLTDNTALDFSVFVDFLTKNDVFSLKNVLFLLFLTFLNWFLEIVKWQKLVATVKKIAFIKALEQSLGALTASLFTPNRIGEYGAKAIYYRGGFRKKIVLLNLLGNITQMVTTILFGLIGISLFITKYHITINYYKLAAVLLVVLLGFVMIGFGIRKSKVTIKGVSIEKIKTFIINFSKKALAQTLLLSVLRYLIFSFQFYFLLHSFKTDIGYFDAMVFITSMYFLSSVIPSIFIFDVVIKGSVAIYLFAFIQVDELTMLSITTLMWLLNFVLPGLFGSYYVLNFNLPKDED
ncbi:lysylphosphatidylglycerol synthase domain-containing protein [Seonamhaeicola sp.]|uniref:lysylphosphatidylglycerol synthase domain-containing protein n=1 Tax=Seonamhaeicola sp. TaxID=1912245 RepID=UPI002616605D|nr:lysylphosphatidylglycerol synthase domain-containing protein [Seonamhaeicola sp.]